MQKADIVLSILGNKALRNESYVFERLYRNLFNGDFYYHFFKKLSKINGNAINIQDKISTELFESEVNETIEKLKREKYYPSEDTKMDDVLELILIEFLQAIYKPKNLHEKLFSSLHEKAHKALLKAKKSFGDVSWSVNFNLNKLVGEIKGEYIVNALKKKVNDGRLLELIKRFLDHERVMKATQEKFITRESVIKNKFISLLEEVFFLEIDEFFESKEIVEHGLRYVRCNSNFFIGIIGKYDELDMKKKLVEGYLSKVFKIDFNKQQFALTSLNTGRAEFLEFEICKSTNGKIDLLVPEKVVREKLKPFLKNNKPVCCSKRINLQPLDIVNMYNKDLKNFYNYYSIAKNFRSRWRKLEYYHYISLLKTLSLKEKMSVRKTKQKYGIQQSLTNEIPTKKVIVIRDINPKNKRVVYYNRFQTLK